METLRERDLRAAFWLLGRVAEAGASPNRLAHAAVQALPALVASEITTLSVCDLRSGRRHVIGAPADAIGPDDRACFDRHFRTHPLVHYHADLRGAGAHRISDSVPFARFRHTALYAEYYRRIGIDHAVALPIRVDDGVLVSFVLNRRGRDFSDRDRSLLDLVGRPLAGLYRLASALQAQGATPLEPADAVAIAASRGNGLTPREREVLHWVGAGKTDRDVAELLGCSHRTVHKHLQRIYVKLGVETRTAAVMRLRAV